MKKQTCCFTGHRVIPAGEVLELRRKLEDAVEDMIGRGVRYFGTGGARGFDTLAAFAVLRLKQRYPHIRLILVLPCPDQTRGWKRSEIEDYQEILAKADKVVMVSPGYTADCMHRRNRRLVDHSAWCVCYLSKPSGGTAYTVEYAKSQGLHIFNLAEKDGQL